MIDEMLSAALVRATDALAEDDAIAASAALREATDACETALRKGLRLDAARLEAHRNAHDRCHAAAIATYQRLRAALSAAGKARRASGAYGR